MNIAPRYEKTKTGILYPLEFYELNFKPKRLFFVSNVETGEIFSVDLQEEEVDAVLPVRKFESVIKNK